MAHMLTCTAGDSHAGCLSHCTLGTVQWAWSRSWADGRAHVGTRRGEVVACICAQLVVGQLVITVAVVWERTVAVVRSVTRASSASDVSEPECFLYVLHRFATFSLRHFKYVYFVIKWQYINLTKLNQIWLNKTVNVNHDVNVITMSTLKLAKIQNARGLSHRYVCRLTKAITRILGFFLLGGPHFLFPSSPSLLVPFIPFFFFFFFSCLSHLSRSS